MAAPPMVMVDQFGQPIQQQPPMMVMGDGGMGMGMAQPVVVQNAPMQMMPQQPTQPLQLTGSQILDASTEAVLLPLRHYDRIFAQKKMIMSKTFPDTTIFEAEEFSTCCCRNYGDCDPIEPIKQLGIFVASKFVADEAGVSTSGGGFDLKAFFLPPLYHTMSFPNKDMKGNEGFSLEREWSWMLWCCGPCKKRPYADVKTKGTYIGKVEHQEAPCCCAPCKEYVALNVVDAQGNEKFTLRHEKADCCKCNCCKGGKCCPCLACIIKCCNGCDFHPINYELRYKVYGPREQPCKDGILTEIFKRGKAFTDFGSPVMSADYKTSIGLPVSETNDKILLLALLEYLDMCKYKVEGVLPGFRWGNSVTAM